MENIKRINFEGSNLIVYVKIKGVSKYEALASLKNFTIAPNLMYAALYPFEKLERIKEYLQTVVTDQDIKFQVRSAKDRKTVLFQMN